MNSNFFNTNSFFIDQKAKLFKLADAYQIYDGSGNSIGSIQQKVSAGQKILRVLLTRLLVPFYYEILNNNNEKEASISRGWSFFLQKITIKDKQNNVIGIIRQQSSIDKPNLKIFNSEGSLLAEITGDFTGWDCEIKDASNVTIGSITKKWSGALRELFTNVDKYNVNISPEFSDKTDKIAILSAAITVDIILKEWWIN